MKKSLESVNDEFENATKVSSYYQQQFLKFIGGNMGIDDENPIDLVSKIQKMKTEEISIDD